VVSATPNSTACAAADPAPSQALVGQSGSIEIASAESMMNYNALEVKFRQRVMDGLMSTFNYIYARGMTTQRRNSTK
jgi:hypothetical protein